MAKKFIVSTDPLTPEQERSFSAFINNARAGWWHWLPNFWLIVDPTDTLSARDITNELNRVNDTVRAIVIEATPTTWSARTRPDSKGNDMAAWINRNW